MGELRLSWSVLDSINADWFKNAEYVVAILSGGAVPGIYIANLLDVPCYFVRAKGYRGRLITEKLEFSNFDVAEDKVKNRKGLIVDDIYDTGRTLRFVRRWLHELSGVTPMCFVLVTKDPDCDARYLMTVASDTWVVFPWETK